MNPQFRITLMLTGLFAIVALASGMTAQAAPVFSPEATQVCVSEAAAASPALDGHAVLDCVGRSARICMSTRGGDTTIGMMECLEGELKYWDSRLNAAYATRLKTAKEQDRELKSLRSAAASIEKSLRARQRAWITFRDASCLYEQAQWMGGTGGGPATLACHLHETARQTLQLEGWWAQ